MAWPTPGLRSGGGRDFRLLKVRTHAGPYYGGATGAAWSAGPCSFGARPLRRFQLVAVRLKPLYGTNAGASGELGCRSSRRLRSKAGRARPSAYGDTVSRGPEETRDR